jgi:hypothetical protein
VQRVLRIKDTTFIAEAVTSIYTRGYILLKDKTITVNMVVFGSDIAKATREVRRCGDKLDI